MRLALSRMPLYAVTSLVAASCAPDLIEPKEEPPAPSLSESGDGITVDSQGVLHFAAAADFFATLKVVSKLTPQQLDAWEDARGFVSHRREFERAMRQVTAAASPQEADTILSNNGDVVTVVGDEAKPSIRVSGYSSLATRDGLFFVGGTLHKIGAALVVSTTDGQLATIERALATTKVAALASTDQTLTIAPGVRATRYFDGKPADGSEAPLGVCGDRLQHGYSISNRRVEVISSITKIHVDEGYNFYDQYIVVLNVSGYRKVLWSWEPYNTSYSYDSFEFQAEYPRVTGWHTGPNGLLVSDFEYVAGLVSIGAESTPWEGLGWVPHWEVGHITTNNTLKEPSFDKIKLRAKSRGTGEGGWAKICCNYPELYDCGFSTPPPPQPPGPGPCPYPSVAGASAGLQEPPCPM